MTEGTEICRRYKRADERETELLSVEKQPNKTLPRHTKDDGKVNKYRTNVYRMYYYYSEHFFTASPECHYFMIPFFKHAENFCLGLSERRDRLQLCGHPLYFV